MLLRRIIAILAALLLLAWFASSMAANPIGPSYTASTNFILPPYKSLHYEFLTQRPFDGGKVWLSLYNGGTNGNVCVLFDIEKRKVLGQLTNASPVYSSADHSRVLCVSRGQGKLTVAEQVKLSAVAPLRGAGISIPGFLHPKRTAGQDDENFWVLDLKRNKATFVGRLSQHKGAGSSFQPSPDFRFGFNKPTTAGFNNLLYLCDLEQQQLRELHVDGWPAGWWDNRRIVMLSPREDVLFFDVTTEKSSPLISSNHIAGFLNEHGVDHDGQRARPFTAWNGNAFELYITDQHKKWLAEESFLLKVDHQDSRLSVVAPSFKFEWSDKFHPSQKLYVYTGRQSGERSDGVFLRNLNTGTETTLVEPTDAKIFSLPHFYKDSVIYVRSNALWRVDLNGSNKVQLFP